MGATIEKGKQKPYTREQYQRCLKAATDMRNAIDDIMRMPLTPEALNEIYKSKREYDRITLEVVQETYIEDSGEVECGVYGADF